MQKNLLVVSTLAMAVMSGSAFAASGDVIGSGSGNIDITGTVTTSTCALTVASNAQTFKVTKDQIMAAKTGDRITSAESVFTVNNCKGTPLQVTMKGNIPDTDPLFSKFDKEAGVRYTITGVNGTDGRWSWAKTGNLVTTSEFMFSATQAQADAVVFTPASDSDVFNIKTNVLRNAIAIPATLPSELKATYAYNITYK